LTLHTPKHVVASCATLTAGNVIVQREHDDQGSSFAQNPVDLAMFDLYKEVMSTSCFDLT